jgi:hypothetical protein
MRIFLSVAIFVGGLLGLFMTACGGFFTLASIGTRDMYLKGAWAFAGPCALLGVGLLVLCRRAWRKLRVPPGDIPPETRVL